MTHDQSKEFCDEVCANVYLKVSNAWKVAFTIISVVAIMVGAAFTYALSIDKNCSDNTKDIAVVNQQIKSMQDMHRLLKEIHDATVVSDSLK